jgi:hypothetical protein
LAINIIIGWHGLECPRHSGKENTTAKAPRSAKDRQEEKQDCEGEGEGEKGRQ